MATPITGKEMELKGYWATNNHSVGEVVVAEKGD
jgi:hypothetical protein